MGNIIIPHISDREINQNDSRMWLLAITKKVIAFSNSFLVIQYYKLRIILL